MPRKPFLQTMLANMAMKWAVSGMAAVLRAAAVLQIPAACPVIPTCSILARTLLAIGELCQKTALVMPILGKK